jgi:hypothetical protein
MFIFLYKDCDFSLNNLAMYMCFIILNLLIYKASLCLLIKCIIFTKNDLCTNSFIKEFCTKILKN